MANLRWLGLSVSASTDSKEDFGESPWLARVEGGRLWYPAGAGPVGYPHKCAGREFETSMIYQNPYTPVGKRCCLYRGQQVTSQRLAGPECLREKQQKYVALGLHGAPIFERHIRQASSCAFTTSQRIARSNSPDTRDQSTRIFLHKHPRSQGPAHTTRMRQPGR